MKFGDFLRECREKNEWTQPEAAAKIDIEQSYLSKLETGKSYPSEDIYERLIGLYKIDTAALYGRVSSDELTKLKELKQVRSAIVQKGLEQTQMTRSWLVAGLVMLILGGASLGLSVIPTQPSVEYLYRSQAELAPDEPLDTFRLIRRDLPDRPEFKDLIEKQKALLPRIHQLEQKTFDDRGSAFVKKTLQGRRFYEKVSEKEVERFAGNRWFFIPAFGFLLGALGCFYISRKWQ